MKTLRYVLLLGVFTLSASQAIAATVTGLNTFSSGTPALASEVNDNFTNVKSAVDDNNSRISNLDLNNVYSVSAHAFTLSTVSGCTLAKDTFRAWFPTGNNCTASASVHLPHNSTVSSLDCQLRDNSASSAAMLFALHRITTTTATLSRSPIFVTPSSVDSSSWQTLSDITPLSGSAALIDNSKFYYTITVSMGTNGVGNAGIQLALASCTIKYNRNL